MRGGRCRLLVLAMVVMVAVLVCGQMMRGQTMLGQTARAQTAQPSAAEQIRADEAAAGFVRSLGRAVRAEWIDKGPVVRPGGPARPVGGTILFPQMARAAGTIFSGTVTRVARPRTTRGQTLETVAITFHVERAIRGATPGEEFTISQWVGLWSNGQRYRVGERVLLFLYPPSKLGLTSCVAAPMGRFAVDGAGRVLLTAQHLSAFRADPVLGGKSRAPFSDFALAVRRASGEE